MPKPALTIFRPVILFLLFLLLISAVYSPALLYNYLFHDDTLFWVKLKENGFRHYTYDISMSECRFGLAWLLNLENLFVHKVSDLRILRFLGIVISSCSAYLLLLQMRRLSFSNIQSFLIILAIFFLPGFADVIFYGSYSCIFTLCLFLACWSFHKVETGEDKFIPVLSFLAAITIYPSIAMFYWTMTGMYILFNRDTHSIIFKRKLIDLITVGLTGLFIYAALIYLTHKSLPHQLNGSFYSPYNLTLDYAGKLLWFFKEPLTNALNLWNIFPQPARSILVCCFIALTAMVVLAKKFPRSEPESWKNIALSCFWKTGLFIFIFFLTFLPNLAAQGNAAFYRCLIPLTTLVWLVLVWAILRWMEIIPLKLAQQSTTALLFIIVLYAGTTIYHQVLCYRVLPSYIEFTAYKTMAKEVRLNKLDAIYISLPLHYSFERYDEFGVLTSHYLSDIYPLIYCALMETGGPWRPFPLVYLSNPGDHQLVKIDEIYFKKLSDGRMVWKDFNHDGGFHQDDHLIISPYDHGLTLFFSSQKIFSKKLQWYTLDLTGLFSPPNFSRLIK